MIISAYFALTCSFTLGKWVFLSLFSPPQNLKMAIYNNFNATPAMGGWLDLT